MHEKEGIEMDDKQCVAGCLRFDDGELKHHRDCPHYPESLTKLWHDTEAQYIDKIDGLEADLENAVETAFKRGAVDWCKANYPLLYERFSKA